jgi:hypothetical protein
MTMRTSRLVVVVVAAVGWASGSARAHETGVAPLVVGSTAAGGGALRLVRSDNDPVAVTASAASGGFVLYTAADPSFENPEGDDGVFPLLDGTQVTVEIAAIGDTVGVKLRGQSLLAAGDRVVLGTMPTLHAHPEWQLTLPEGASACQTVRLRITAASTYAASDKYVLQISDAPATCPPLATPTATPVTPQPTATPGLASRCGDADGNGTVNVTDGVVVLRTAAGLGSGCGVLAACDLDGNGAVNVTDGVNVLRSAAGLSADLTCPDL